MPKSASEEQVLADEAVPSSTKYKNKWALKLFQEWQQQREMKVPIVDRGGLCKDYELHKVNPVSCEIEDMDTISLNYWLTKVCNGSRQRFRGKVSTQNCVRDSVWCEASFGRQKWQRGVESTCVMLIAKDTGN